MLYELDFLPVGEGEYCGDAICLRYSLDEGASWFVGVVDGGTQESGERLCEHIKKYYGTERVQFLVCSHPDKDHASGLAQVLESLTVEKVVMHCPWNHVDDIFDRVSDGRVTKESLKRRLIEDHPYAYKVYELAVERDIPIYDGFSDLQNHGVPYLTIAGPSKTFYLDQLVNFRSIKEITEKEPAEQTGILNGVRKAAEKLKKWVTETWDSEKLVDPEDDSTTSENNSSTVLMLDFDGEKKLLTADAGVAALEHAADYLANKLFVLKDFSFIQVPHHGSKRNVGPSVLNRLIGAPVAEGSEPTFSALVSASKGAEPKHPNKRVVNAFIRRGARVIATQGSSICHHSPGAPDRGWSKARALPFYDEVEDDD